MTRQGNVCVIGMREGGKERETNGRGKGEKERERAQARLRGLAEAACLVCVTKADAFQGFKDYQMAAP